MLITCFLKQDTKEGSISSILCSNCKYSLNFTCHAHKRNATEVTKFDVVKPFYSDIYNAINMTRDSNI